MVTSDKYIYFPDCIEFARPRHAYRPGAVLHVARNEDESSYEFVKTFYAFNGGTDGDLVSSELLEKEKLADQSHDLLREDHVRIGAAIDALPEGLQAGFEFLRRDISKVEHKTVEKIQLRKLPRQVDTLFYDSISKNIDIVVGCREEKHETKLLFAIPQETFEVGEVFHHQKKHLEVGAGAAASNTGSDLSKKKRSFPSFFAGFRGKRNRESCYKGGGMIGFTARLYKVIMTTEVKSKAMHVSRGVVLCKPDSLRRMIDKLSEDNDNIICICYEEFRNSMMPSWGILMDVSRLDVDENFRKRVDEAQKRFSPDDAAPDNQPSTMTRQSWWKALLLCVVIVVVFFMIVWLMRRHDEEVNRYKEKIRLCVEEVNRYKEKIRLHVEEEHRDEEKIRLHVEEEHRDKEKIRKLNERWIEFKQMVMPIGVGFVYAAERDGKDAETSGFLSFLACAFMTLALAPFVDAHPLLKKIASRLPTLSMSKQREVTGINEVREQLERHGFVPLAHSPDALYDDRIDPFLRFVRIIPNKSPEPVEFHYPRAAIEALLDIFLNDKENEMTHDGDSPKSKGSLADSKSTDDETEVPSPTRLRQNRQAA